MKMTYEQNIDQQEVEKIIETMKKKYREEGLEFSEVSGGLKELRGIIAEDTYARQDIETKDDLDVFDSSFMQKLGQFYLKLKNFLKPFKGLLKRIPLNEEIGFYLYSANMPYSANQYLALSSAAGVMAALVGFVAGLFIGTFIAATTGSYVLLVLMPLLFMFVGGVFATGVMLLIPRLRAEARGNACSIELPFALRHMSTELKAGLGLYKTLQAVTAADYGVLSEEFARTMAEIEEGTDTSAALKHLALRTQSKPLKSAINHMLRAMRVGGNLSVIMNEIANEVSADLKDKIKAFSQKMNLFAVIFIFIFIVLPVAIMILGAIKNSPLGETAGDLFKSVPLPPETLVLMYLVIMPVLFAGMIFIVYTMQPKM